MARLLASLVVPPIITKFGMEISEETGQAVANSTEVLLGETNEGRLATIYHWLRYNFIFKGSF